MKAIETKIRQLSAEADDLVRRKMAAERELNNIETRLTQIVGAITELNSLIQEEAKGDGD